MKDGKTFHQLLTSIRRDLHDAKNAEARRVKLEHRAGAKLLDLYEQMYTGHLLTSRGPIATPTSATHASRLNG